MDRFRSGKSLSPIRQAEAYWTALCDRNGVPYRTRIDPRALENILHHAFILEQVAPTIARFRLAGNDLNEAMHMDVRGMPISALFVAPARPAIGQILGEVFTAPAIAELSLMSEGVLGRGRVEARMILLPLKDDGGNVTRALGMFVSDGARGTRTIRFDVTGQTVRPLSHGQADPAPRAPAEPGFAEPQAPFSARAPYLKVVK